MGVCVKAGGGGLPGDVRALRQPHLELVASKWKRLNLNYRISSHYSTLPPGQNDAILSERKGNRCCPA